MLALLISFGSIAIVYALHQWYETKRQRRRKAKWLREEIERRESRRTKQTEATQSKD